FALCEALCTCLIAPVSELPPAFADAPSSVFASLRGYYFVQLASLGLPCFLPTTSRRTSSAARQSDLTVPLTGPYNSSLFLPANAVRGPDQTLRCLSEWRQGCLLIFSFLFLFVIG